jgi:hypothetical protein
MCKFEDVLLRFLPQTSFLELKRSSAKYFCQKLIIKGVRAVCKKLRKSQIRKYADLNNLLYLRAFCKCNH